MYGKHRILVRVNGIEPCLLVDTLVTLFDDPCLDKYVYCVTFEKDSFDEEAMAEFSSAGIDLRPVEGSYLRSSSGGRLLRAIEPVLRVSPRMYAKIANQVLAREFNRRFGGESFERVIDLGLYSREDAEVLSTHPRCELMFARSYGGGVPSAQPTVQEIELFLLNGAQVSISPPWLEERLSPPASAKGNRVALVHPRFSVKKGVGLGVDSLVAISSVYPHRIDDLRLRIGADHYRATLNPVVGSNQIVKGLGLYRIKAEIPREALATMGEENRIRAEFVHNGNVSFSRAITYRALRKRYKGLHGRLLRFNGSGNGETMCAYFRQTRRNTLILTVRTANVTDLPRNQIKLWLAWAIAKIPVSNRPVIVFEKNAQSYRESGKAVFERLCKQGCDVLRFVLPSTQIDGLSGLPKECRGKFLPAHTFAHYLAFFRARVFIGTELPLHALERNAISYLAYGHLNKKNRTWVFLQHGVMYMVSLDAFQREFFRRKSFGCKAFVVVSSRAEAQHFVQLGGYQPDETLVSGLAKFDFATQDPDADKIVIVPTWRPWEYASAQNDPMRSSYWQMIERIRSAVPDTLKDKVVVQAHPLFQKANADCVADIDGLLRKTRVLITDYSSVAYDAFYRGAAVVFYWEDLDACMQQYGGTAHLMIDEETAPGYVCRTADDVADAVVRAYYDPRPSYHVENFERIVEFHDGKNTERLVRMLEERGII